MAFVKRARLPQAEDSAPMRVSRIGSPIVTPTEPQKARSAIKRESGSEASPDSSTPSLNRREAEKGV